MVDETVIYTIYVDPDVTKYLDEAEEEVEDEEHAEHTEHDENPIHKRKAGAHHHKVKQAQTVEEELAYAEFHLTRYKPETERGGACVLNGEGKWVTVAAFYRSHPRYFVAAAEWKERVLIMDENATHELLWDQLKDLREQALQEMDQADNVLLSPSRRFARKECQRQPASPLEQAEAEAKRRKDDSLYQPRSSGLTKSDQELSPSAGKVDRYERMVSDFLSQIEVTPRTQGDAADEEQDAIGAFETLDQEYQELREANEEKQRIFDLEMEVPPLPLLCHA